MSGRTFTQYLLIIMFMTTLLPQAVPPCGAAEAKQVVFVRFNLKDDTPDSVIVEEFKKTMAARGYEEGTDIEYIDFVTHNPERESAGEVLQLIEEYKDSADMFITTSWTSLYVRSKLAKTHVPQLFAPALKSTALNMLPSLDKEPDTNLSGVYLMYPPEKVLRFARLLLPGLKRYAYVYDSRIPADTLLKSAYGVLSDRQRHGFEVFYLDLAAGTDTAMQQLRKLKIEAFGGAVGLFKRMEHLSRAGLPIVTSLLFDRGRDAMLEAVKSSNVLAGLYNPFDLCGRQAAEMTADIFDGRTTIEKTMPQPARQLAVINLHAAERLRISVPVSALEAADIVIR
ncbi:MAG: hypothetical protein Kow0089_03370 [Desulfobulbaceae bacterium]